MRPGADRVSVPANLASCAWRTTPHGRLCSRSRSKSPPSGIRCANRDGAGGLRVLGPGAGARARRDRRGRRNGDRRGGEHFHVADHRFQGRADAAVAARLAVRGIFRRILQESARPGRQSQPRAHPAPRQLARLRVHHRCVRHRGDQQSRHLRCRRDQRHPQRRNQAQGRDHRSGSEDRHRAAPGEARESRSRR